MDYKELKISNVIIVNGKVVLSVRFINPDENIELQNKPINYFKDKLQNKRLLIVGDNYSLETHIKDMQATFSFIGTKNLHFLTKLADIGDIKANDLVMIID